MLLRPSFRLVVVAFGLVALAAAAENEQWITLFDGKTLSGWKRLDGQARIEVRDRMIVGVVTPGVKQNSFLATEETFGDFIFEGEFKAEPGLNSGVQFRSRPADDSVKRVYGYQYEIDPTPRALTGGVQEEGRRTWLAPTANHGAPRDEWVKAHGDPLKSDAWNFLRIECRGAHIRTWLNETLIADFDDNTDVRIPRGFIALQVHHSDDPKLAGKEVAFRHLRVRKLD
jgi:hypothetical protein